MHSNCIDSIQLSHLPTYKRDNRQLPTGYLFKDLRSYIWMIFRTDFHSLIAAWNWEIFVTLWVQLSPPWGIATNPKRWPWIRKYILRLHPQIIEKTHVYYRVENGNKLEQFVITIWWFAVDFIINSRRYRWKQSRFRFDLRRAVLGAQWFVIHELAGESKCRHLDVVSTLTYTIHPNLSYIFWTEGVCLVS